MANVFAAVMLAGMALFELFEGVGRRNGRWGSAVAPPPWAIIGNAAALQRSRRRQQRLPILYGSFDQLVIF